MQTLGGSYGRHALCAMHGHLSHGGAVARDEKDGEQTGSGQAQRDQLDRSLDELSEGRSAAGKSSWQSTAKDPDGSDEPARGDGGEEGLGKQRD